MDTELPSKVEPANEPLCSLIAATMFDCMTVDSFFGTTISYWTTMLPELQHMEVITLSILLKHKHCLLLLDQMRKQSH